MARSKQPPRGRTRDENGVKAEDAASIAGELSAETEIDAATEAEDEALDAAEETPPIAAEAPAEETAPVVVEPAVTEPSLADAEPAVAIAVETSAPDELPATGEPGTVEIASVAMAATIPVAGFTTIVTEVTDYSKKSVENATTFVRKLLGAKTVESAIRIQSDYAKTSYVDFVAHVTKIGEIYSKLAMEALERRSYHA